MTNYSQDSSINLSLGDASIGDLGVGGGLKSTIECRNRRKKESRCASQLFLLSPRLDDKIGLRRALYTVNARQQAEGPGTSASHGTGSSCRT